MKIILCWFGIHSYGSKRGWHFSGMDSWHWFKRCQRCGKEKRLRNFYELPPSRFHINEHGVYEERLLPGYKKEDFI
jgi:hypothetical protein